MTEDPPAGFLWRRADGLLVCMRRSAEEQILAALRCGPETLIREEARSRSRSVGGSGRGAIARLEVSGAGAVLRKYRRGGVGGALLPDLFLGRGRALAELRICESARGMGLPVPEPLAALFRSRGPLCVSYLLSREIQGRSIALILGGASRREAVDLLAAVARLARRCHDAGLVHADLNLGNVLLIEGSDPTTVDGQPVALVDLDRSRIRASGLGDSERFANLSRLARSHEKIFGREGPWGSDPIPSLLRAYCAGDESLQRRLGTMLDKHARSMRLHRLGWKLGSLFHP